MRRLRCALPQGSIHEILQAYVNLPKENFRDFAFSFGAMRFAYWHPIYAPYADFLLSPSCSLTPYLHSIRA